MNDNRNYNALRDTLSGIAMVLHSADVQGLNPPTFVGPLDSSEGQRVAVHLDTRADFDAWTDWTTALVQPTTLVGDSIYTSSQGEMFELPLSILFITPIKCTCGHRPLAHSDIGCQVGTCFCSRTVQSVRIDAQAQVPA